MGFIGGSEEVKKAILYGLHSNVTQLVKLLQTSCGDKGCCKDEKIKLNEVNESLKNHLNEEQNASKNLTEILSECNLKDLGGPLKQLNDEIPKKIEKLTRQIEKLKKADKDDNNSKNASKIDTLNKDLQSHKASKRSLETLDGLCGFAGKVNSSPSGECKNILNNLCDGLQTFLGYNEHSKGYDGSGIVYSDLDRLCDGVMSFLHGVLQTVKNDSNLNKYANTLEKSVNELKTAQGKSGLKGVLGRVTSGIGNYVHEFEKDSEAFKSALNTLDSNHIKTYSKALESLNSAVTDQNDELVKQLNQCNQAAGQFTAQLSVVEDNFKRLDENLKNRLKDDYNTIKLEVTRFAALAGNGVLLEVLEDVDKKAEELGKLKGQHEKEHQKLVTEKVAQLKREIQQEIDRIIKDVSSIESDLQKWIAQAESFVKEAERKANLILPEVDDTQGKEAITKNARALQDKAEKLLTALQETHGKVTKLPQEINENLNKLEKVYTEKIREVATGVHRKVTAALQKLGGLDKQVRKGLWNLGGTMDVPIRDVISKLQGGVTQAAALQINAGSGETMASNFQKGLTKGDVPKLWDWASAAKDDSAFIGALAELGHTAKTCGNHNIHPDHSFQTFKSLLSKLDVKNNSGHTLFSALIEDLTNKVKDALHNTKDDGAFRNSFDEFNKHTIKGGPDTLRKDIDNIKIDGDGITLMSGNGSYTVDADNFRGYKESGDRGPKALLKKYIGVISEVLKPFQQTAEVASPSDLEKNKEPVNKALAQITLKLKELTAHLKDDSRDRKRKGIIPLLKELQKHIGERNADGLKAIKERIKKLHTSELVQLQSSAVQKLQAAQETAHEVIGVVHDLYQEQIKLAVTAIRTAARDQYNATVHKALQALTQLYEKHKKLIEDAIKTDEASGIKGLMKEINDNKTLLETLKTQAELKTATPQLRIFADLILDYIHRQVMTPSESSKTSTPVSHPTENLQSRQISLIKSKLGTLLDDLSSSHHFDHIFSNNLQLLIESLSGLSSTSFGEGVHPELLNVVVNSVTGLNKHLSCAYVNTYSGRRFTENLVDAAYLVTDVKNGETIITLNEYGEKLSKVCLTLLTILQSDLNKLSDDCNGNYAGRKIYAYTDTKENPLGALFNTIGYKVASKTGDRDGELRNRDEMRGRNIVTLLKQNDYLVSKKATALSTLFNHLSSYYTVCHHSTFSATRSSSSIFEILSWLSGFPYNHMYAKLRQHVNALFLVPDKSNPSTKISQAIDAYPVAFYSTDIHSALDDVCSRSHSVLTAILGNGHADGVYACDYSNNYLNLRYPNNPGQCFDLLVELSCRLYHQLMFLFRQCHNGRLSGGWRDCHYGKGIAGSSWNCNKFQCPNQDCVQKHNQSTNQSANQNTKQRCDQHYDCGLKSPLQSFLEDGLVGFLPHAYNKPNCNLTCSFGNHRGLPCITPMGFTDITHKASRRQRGEDLEEVLAKFCSDKNSALSKLCAYITCLVNRPPQNLGDLFSFFQGYLENWRGNFYGVRQLHPHTQEAFNDAVRDAHFGNTYAELDPSFLFNRTDHVESHTKGDLLCITTCKSEFVDTCGLYLEPLAKNIYSVFSSSHQRNHLSWIVYLTEKFYDLLKKLYDDCNNKCGKKESRCRGNTCVKGCPTGSTSNNSSTHKTECGSIVKCRHTLPTLFKYGFTFGSSYDLSGMGRHPHQKRTCKNLCDALSKVIDKGCALLELRKQIDNYIWKIRENFSITLLALWSLSLLYLLHIAVVRLDVLRIRSHLRSPSSHRIAAQSLLAAARVKALANDARGKALGDIDARRISLGTLAGQLMGFIGGTVEVKNAIIKGLQSNVNQLEKLLQTSCGGEGCNCNIMNFRDGPLKNLQNKFNEVDKIERQIDGLNKEIAEKSEASLRTPSGGDTEIKELEEQIKQNEEKLKQQKSLVDKHIEELKSALNTPKIKIDEYIKKLNEKIADINKKIEAHKKEEKKKNSLIKDADISIPSHLSHPLATEQAKLKSHKTSLGSLESLEKLITFHEEVSKNPKTEECKNILTNLCSGLEKFLGYQETSKGYSGDGIVYSDLDRLCDGVMSFLHGVLNDVYKNNNLSPYKEKLDKAVRDLETHRYNGKTGLHTVIDHVKEGIAGWLEAVQLSNKNITGQLEKFIDKDENSVTTVMEHIVNFTGAEYDSVLSTLDSWTVSVGKLKKHPSECFKNIQEIDGNLKEQLKPHVDVIDTAVDAFVDSALTSKFGLVKVCERVDEEFGELDKKVEDGLGEEKGLRGKLKSEVAKIKNNIDREYKKDLERSIDLAKRNLKRLLSDESSLKGLDTKLKPNVDTAFNDIKLEVTSVHRNLDDKKKVIDGLVSNVGRYISYIKKVVGEEDEQGSITIYWTLVRDEITRVIGHIVGSGSKKSGLRGIKEKVKEYAERFTKVKSERDDGPNNFENILDGWVDDILVSQPIRGWIEQWVKFNKGHFKGNLSEEGKDKDRRVAVRTAIISSIKAKLHEEIMRAGEKVEQGKAKEADSDSITKNVNAVRDGCETFATELGEKINEKGNDILSAIRDELVDPKKQPKPKAPLRPYNDHWLTLSLHAVLPSIVAKAGQVAVDLISFTSTDENPSKGIKQYKLGKNIYDAIKNAESIYTTLTGYSTTIDNALQTLKDQIEELDRISQPSGALKSKVEALSEDIKKLETLKNGASDKGTIETQKENVTKELAQLKQKIEADIQSVIATLNTAQSQLTKLLNEIEKALTEFQTAFLAAIQAFQSAYKQQSTKSKNAIKQEALSQFAQSKAHALEQLKALVTEKNKEIAAIIQDDSNSGLKGMMKAMYGGELNLRVTVNSQVYTKSNLLEELKSAVTAKPVKDQTPKKVSDLCTAVDAYLREILAYVGMDIKTQFESEDASMNAYHTKLQNVFNAFDGLFSHITKHNYDAEFLELLKTFRESLDVLHPREFRAPTYPVLDALKSGLTKLSEKLDEAYVNKYSGAREITWQNSNSEPTDKAKKCAKICLTVFNDLFREAQYLFYHSTTKWKDYTVGGNDSQSKDKLRKYFEDQGYQIYHLDKNKTGNAVAVKLSKGLGSQDEFRKPANANITFYAYMNSATNPENPGTLQKLYKYINQYNRMCHLIYLPKPRYPCNVFQMLAWVAGLKHNAVFTELTRYLPTLHEAGNDHHFDLAFKNVVMYHIHNISEYSRNLITAILGTGSAETMYACDISNNSMKLHYPKSGGDCLHTLLDLLRRLLPPLRYLRMQCSVSAQHNGWRDCAYGKHVPSANWQCNDHSNAKPSGQPKGQPTCQPNSKPKCEPRCRPTSPLMSYLNDCLPGHLPHDLKSVGCSSKCSTCPKSTPGMPCLTPLGFRGFSGSTKTGKDLCKVLTEFFDDVDFSALLCAVPKPPFTLPEHFQFALSLVNEWHDRKSAKKHAVQAAFEKSIERVSIALVDEPDVLTSALTKAYGSTYPRHGKCEHAHVRNLTTADSCNEKTSDKIDCAPYLSSLSCDSYKYMAEKHSKTYLSWAIYLPWTFWDLLNNLYNAFCGITCADWGCRGCLRGDKCKSGKHGVVEDEKKADAVCQCESIVSCRGVAPTLYQYGFTFGEASTLNGKTPKKCEDFCSQLHNVLHSQYFKDLFRECDNFLCIIRWPFMSLLLALWSLSLLYLLHIAVVRLDVLRIRSHLRSPSSHRIAAQSLLAAARVRALANVKYFSP
ncbi:hypothetical protein, conserved [Babesia ovata]|uniref:C3H1-type domain-containing protein n=1 Tax=Babesia ovata TaxID=189622 RepID=A0A2H6KK73_9APIC|nr:uncharacterized protein BOVATA_048890 [Babesia ovata]GBE63396.1 hypothetical protein, conserved [Babesia ovata]